MQDSLFSAQAPESKETIEEVNEELLRRAKALPQFRERVFIFGEGT
jgi:D-arabinose 5-phosphate isomerase GutQ